MEWKDEYSLGIEEIDEQHKLLLRSFADVEEAMKSGRGWSDSHYAIVELTNVARRHFAFEEALMRLFGYPGTEAHGRGHQHFFATLEKIERHCLQASAESEMVRFLREWLTRHILGDDRDYAKHILAGAHIVTTGTHPAAAPGSGAAQLRAAS